MTEHSNAGAVREAPEITEYDTTAAREWFDQAEHDGIIRRGSRKAIPLLRLIARAREEGARQALAALPPDVSGGGEPFQQRVAPWMDACFGADISADKVERGDRLLEETLELLQSGGYDRVRVAALTEYVWSRPAGEPTQEVGGVMVTLAAYCLAHGFDMHQAGETELTRIWGKVDQIRAKQAAKPTGSALPIATAHAQPETKFDDITYAGAEALPETQASGGVREAAHTISLAPLNSAICGLQPWLTHDLECPTFTEPTSACSCGLKTACAAVVAELTDFVSKIENAPADSFEIAATGILDAGKPSKGGEA